MDLLIVESPAKAKTINKYLGSNFNVLASFGHIRDLPSKDGSVNPDDDFAMRWEIEPDSEARIKNIATALKKCDRLVLATDPDREGEAISWHLQDILQERGLLKGKKVERVVFHEITKNAILAAMQKPRDVHAQLVDAYLARRALDYLVGFNLSPVLWRKLPGSRSAGRVQSVSLRLICERESEIERFKAEEYWTISADFTTPKNAAFEANLFISNGEKLEKFSIPDEKTAKAIQAQIEGQKFSVIDLEQKTVKRNPSPPFTTSTLQQEASRKLGFGASKTMRVAQKLYEGVDVGGESVGLISYMRTDSIQMGMEAIQAARDTIAKRYGDKYLPSSPRVFKSKTKNTQEAHEAVRPTDFGKDPSYVSKFLAPDEARLYELIWQRATASQMEQAVSDQTTVTLANDNQKFQFRATGSVPVFDGFMKLYKEDFDDKNDDEDTSRMLPKLVIGDVLKLGDVKPDQHFTEPPPRYSEASLVKKMEELGIGRPSTYASIIQVLQDRNYVRLDKKRFFAEDRGRIVVEFLKQYFSRYVEYDFTAQMEDTLDQIANGEVAWKKVLRDFWQDFFAAIKEAGTLKISDVTDRIDQELGDHFFPARADGSSPRQCPVCADGRLGLKIGKTGGFIGCSNYPNCRYTRALEIAGTNEDGSSESYPKLLGQDPALAQNVTLRKGPYGFYVQLGDGEKPKRAALLKGMAPETVDIEKALRLLALPRELGIYPENGEMIFAGIGRFGPFLRVGKTFYPMPKEDDVMEIGLNRAITVVHEKSAGAKFPIVLGKNPEGNDVSILKGRFGPFISCGSVNVPLKMNEVEGMTLDEAVLRLNAKAAKPSTGASKTAKAGTKKINAKKTKTTTKRTKKSA